MTYLRNGERFAAVALPTVFSMAWETSGDPVAWGMRGAAMAMVVYLLLQGMLYWQLKLQSTVRRQPLPAYFRPLYDTRGAFDYVRLNGRLRRAALGLDLRRHNPS